MEMGEKPPLEDERVSHTICKSCQSYFIKPWTGLQLGESVGRLTGAMSQEKT
jgi:hypothetical protein